MHRRTVLLSGLGVACAPWIAARAQATADPFIEVVRRVRQSVVAIARVEVERNTVPAVMGTAFAVGDGRHLITNAHVAAPAGGGPVAGIHALVRLGSGTDRRRAQIVEIVPEADLALLSIDGPPLPALSVRSDPELLPEGTAVAITGFPIGMVLGPVPATHRGIIAALAPNASQLADSRGLDAAFIKMGRYLVYQLDILALPGNSGSPLYRVDTGEVIGVINASFIKKTKEKALSDPSAIAFAIPSGLVASLLEHQQARR